MNLRKLYNETESRLSDFVMAFDRIKKPYKTAIAISSFLFVNFIAFNTVFGYLPVSRKIKEGKNRERSEAEISDYSKTQYLGGPIRRITRPGREICYKINRL